MSKQNVILRPIDSTGAQDNNSELYPKTTIEQVVDLQDSVDKAETAIQPDDNISELTNDVGYTVVSGSATGTATDTINYLKIDNVEYKLPSPGSVVPTIGYAVQSMPVKGDLITMMLGNVPVSQGSRDLYRVLNITDNIAEVMAMYNASDSQVFGSSERYFVSLLDTYLNSTWYSSLSSSAKAAIVDKTIYQYEYNSSGSQYNYNTHCSYAEIPARNQYWYGSASRHVYSLGISDIETYFSGTFGATNLWNFFWNSSTSVETKTGAFWLRSAWWYNSDTGHQYAWRVPDSAKIEATSYTKSYGVRPAFQIDLSKISWEEAD